MKKLMTITILFVSTACHDSQRSDACWEWCNEQDDTTIIQQLEADLEDADSYANELEQELEKTKQDLKNAVQTANSCIDSKRTLQNEFDELSNDRNFISALWQECDAKLKECGVNQ